MVPWRLLGPTEPSLLDARPRMRRAPIDATTGGRTATFRPPPTAPPRRGGPAPRSRACLPRLGASASSSFETVTDRRPPGRQNAPSSSKPRRPLPLLGNLVSAPNLSLVLTAGHCVDSGGVVADGYTGAGSSSRAIVTARCLRCLRPSWPEATTGWVATRSENVTLAPPSSGRRKGAAAGRRGRRRGHRLQPQAETGLRHRRLPGRPALPRGNPAALSQTPFLGHDPESFFALGPLNLAVD